MRIRRADDERLIIVHFPLGPALLGLLPVPMAVLMVHAYFTGKPGYDWGGVVFAVLFTLGWGAVFSLFLKRDVFDFSISGRQITWNRSSMFGNRSQVLSFDEIECAKVDALCSGDGTSYRPMLVAKGGPFPLMAYHMEGQFRKREYQQIVEAINKALKDRSSSSTES